MAPAARRLYAKGVFTGFKRGKLQSKYQQSRRKLFLKTLILLRFHFDLNCHQKYLIFSFKGLRNQHENTALVKVEGCANKDDSKWYIGKRCAYVYRVSQYTNLIQLITLSLGLLFWIVEKLFVDFQPGTINWMI